MIEDEKAKSLHTEVWSEKMRTPDEVAAMLRLRELGWGTKRIAKELCVSRNTVKRYLEAQGFVASQTPSDCSVAVFPDFSP